MIGDSSSKVMAKEGEEQKTEFAELGKQAQTELLELKLRSWSNFFKQRFYEKPDLFISLGIFVVGFFGVITIGEVSKRNRYQNVHRIKYTVIRREDVKDESKLNDVYN